MSVALYRYVEFVIIVFILARFHSLYAFTLLHKHIIIEQLKNHLLIKMVVPTVYNSYVPKSSSTGLYIRSNISSSQLSIEKAQNI
jgi:hypothetical protein